MTTTDLAATASAAPKLRLPLTFVCSLIAAATIDGRTRLLTTDAWQVAATRRLQGALHHDRTEAGYLVRQAGPRRIWDELVTLHQQWCARGRPGYDRFGITLNTDATALWLDEPDGPRWERHIDGHMPVPR
ncbi:MAG: hypothetical protein LH603_03455 [Pseudonocardia sp.]|nr:hypothetical protein [Pseudonocardia sp.]